jgi:glycosyltransferase involved in cell wall biosynthesis
MEKENTKLLLSVALITYNHEKYIRQALDSILMQITDFDFEIIIGDDHSTDSTPDICKEYALKHPNIKYQKYDKNEGISPNWRKTIERCNGKYIALIEGDDYWTENYKLQKQVNFLETNQDYSLCFHNHIRIYEHEPLKKPDMRANHVVYDKEYKVKELYKKWPIHTVTTCFRKDKLSFSENFDKFFFCDWVVFIHLAENGRVMGFIDAIATYRLTGTSATGNHSPEYFLKLVDKIYVYFDIDFNNRYKSITDYWRAVSFRRVALAYSGVNYFSSIKYIFKAITCDYLLLSKKRTYKEILKILTYTKH